MSYCRIGQCKMIDLQHVALWWYIVQNDKGFYMLNDAAV